MTNAEFWTVGYTPRYTMKNQPVKKGMIHVIHANGL